MILDWITSGLGRDKPVGLDLRSSSLENPDTWLIDALGGQKTQAGVPVNDSNVMSYGAIFAAVRIIAEKIGAFPWHVFERLDDDNRRMAREHPLDWTLHTEANPEISSQAFREGMQVNAILSGNGYAEIKRNVLDETDLEPIAPNRVKVKRRPDGSIFYEVRNQLENGLIDPQSDPVQIESRDMFHLRGVTRDGLVGLFMLELAKGAVGLGLATEKFGATWFGNHARPAGLLKYPGVVTEKIRANLEKAKSLFLGKGDEPNQVGILSQGMEWVPLSVNPNESQFLETRKFQVTEVSRFTGVPPHMLAELDRATFSNIEHQSIQFVTYALMSWITRWEIEADRKLLATPGDRRNRGRMFTKMNENALLRGDTATRTKLYVEMIRSGVFSPNDVRRLEDMNTIGKDGDQHFLQAQMVPLGQIGQTAVANPRRAGRGADSGADGANPEAATSDPVSVEKLKKAHARAFADALERMLRKEVMAANRAYGRSHERFAVWAAKFYGEHESQIIEALSPTALALAETLRVAASGQMMDTGMAHDVASVLALYAAEHVKTSQAELAEALDTGALAELTKLWLVQRPAQAAVELTDRIGALVKASGDVQ